MKYCKECNGTGFNVREDPAIGESIAYPCECRKKQDVVDLRRKRLTASNIPSKYWEYTIDKYEKEPFDDAIVKANARSVRNLKHLIEKPGDFLEKYNVLWIWGRGRLAFHTSLSVAFAASLIDRGYKVKFLLMQKLLDSFVDFDHKQEYFQSLNEADAFLIDNAFMSSVCTAKEYALVQLYNWLLDMMNQNKYFICNAKNSIREIDQMFASCKYLLLKSNVSLEFQGSFADDIVDSEDEEFPWEK